MASSRAIRHEAVSRGLDFIYEYLSEESPRRVILLGEQCVEMFFDVAQAEADNELCAKAKRYALEMLTVLDHHWRATWPLPWNDHQFLEVITLIRYAGMPRDSQRPLSTCASQGAPVRECVPVCHLVRQSRLATTSPNCLREQTKLARLRWTCATSRSPKAATLTGKRVSSPPQIGLTSCGRRSYTSTQTSFSRTVFALRQG